MASNNEKGKITIANVIAVFGIVLLTALLFLGFLYTGDTPGISILKGCGLGCVFALLLWLMMTAKSKTNLEDKGKWLITEYTALALYIALAVLSFQWMTPFVNVYTAKDNIKDAVRNDIEAINTAIDDFKNNERPKMLELCNNLKTALREERMDASVEGLLCHLLGESSLDDVYASTIDSSIYELYADSIANVSEANGWDIELSDCEKEIRRWNILRLPQLIKKVSDLSADITEQLNDFAKRIPHYAVHDNPDVHMFFAEQQSADTYEAEVTTPAMMQKLNSSPWGYGACVLIHLLILFNYLVTRRSSKIRNLKKNETAMNGGRMLNSEY